MTFYSQSLKAYVRRHIYPLSVALILHRIVKNMGFILGDLGLMVGNTLDMVVTHHRAQSHTTYVHTKDNLYPALCP